MQTAPSAFRPCIMFPAPHFSLAARVPPFNPLRDRSIFGSNALPSATQSAVWIHTRPANISTDASKPSVIRPAARKAALLPFVFVMYAYATGGPFGLEDMVSTSGPGLA